MATLGELAVVLGVLGTVTASAIPRLLTGLDDARAAGAARYMSSRLAQARMEAVARSREVAIRFTRFNGVYSFTVYEDGNDNGVLTRDVQRGIDRAIVGSETLPDNFRNVDFGVQPGLPAIEPGGAPPAGDPITLGAGNSVSFSRLGSATPGTIYLAGVSGAQYALRIVGVTGKIRLYRFNRSTWKWVPI
jgi:type II secretory pathway pseudopilin PulG